MDYDLATKPFEFGEGKEFVILSHGYTGNPYELRELGQYLANNGFHVLAPLLVGHGKNRTEFLETRWPDWYSQIEYTISLINEKFDPNHIFMAGLSIGGAFSLYTGVKHAADITAIAPIAAPVFLTQKLLWLLPLVRLLRIKYFPYPMEILTMDKEIWTDPIFLENIKRYDKFVIPTVASLLSFLKDLKNKELPNISLPILISHGIKDTYVHPSNASYIYEHVSSSQKKLLWLENSNHLATVDFDKDLLFNEITQFFQGYL
ncbi:MAG: alpha/beta fold hydrolase [Candidatus Heimdallarchaeota archaeon]|nr:alpha/beta fold hydrolase [Candidatus Heimdallarchaeota archaeon]